MVALILLAVGLVLVVAGVAFIYWPAALVVAGIGVALVALYVDFDTIGKGRT